MKDPDLIHFRKILLIVLTGKCFKYKGAYYEYIGVVRMKDPTSREWLMAVKYRPVLENTECIRELKDFNSNFMKVNGLNEITL